VVVGGGTSAKNARHARLHRPLPRDKLRASFPRFNERFRRAYARYDAPDPLPSSRSRANVSPRCRIPRILWNYPRFSPLRLDTLAATRRPPVTWSFLFIRSVMRGMLSRNIAIIYVIGNIVRGIQSTIGYLDQRASANDHGNEDLASLSDRIRDMDNKVHQKMDQNRRDSMKRSRKRDGR